MVRVILPQHLRTLAKVNGEVLLDVSGLSRSRRFSMCWKRVIRCCEERFGTM